MCCVWRLLMWRSEWRSTHLDNSERPSHQIVLFIGNATEGPLRRKKQMGLLFSASGYRRVKKEPLSCAWSHSE